jgi:hypothetical protein
MIVLLPERRRLSATPTALAAMLGRGDRLPDAQAGERAQLLRHFELVPQGWPMAAITRAFDAADAGEGTWLRADPAHALVEATGARLHAIGSLGLDREEVDDFLAVLRPVFGDAGVRLDAPTPERWYLSLPDGAPVPDFADPASALGADLFPLLPAGREGRRWRALFNEAQVLLHQHPRNAARIAAGRAPVNALWFWGAGRLPHAVRSDARAVLSDDVEMLALARLAGRDGAQEIAPGTLVDLRRLRDAARLEAVLRDAMREAHATVLDFADGARWQLQPAQRWRFWRRPTRLAAD